MSKRFRSKYEGVYYRERKEPHNGRPDRSYDFCYASDGKKTWVYAGRASLGVTAEIARDMRLKAMAGIRIGSEDPKLGPCLDLFERESRLNYGPQSAGSRLSLSKVWLRPMAEERMSTLTRARLSEWVAEISKTKAKSTTSKIAAALREAINLGIEQGVWPGPNPAAKLKIHGEIAVCERFLTREEASALLNELDPEWRAMCQLSLLTGLRMVEILRLVPEDIGAATLRVTGKSGKRETVHLRPEARELLESRLERRPMFAKQDDGRFYKAVNKLGLNAGIQDVIHKVRFHTMRHTFASWLAQAGADSYAVQRLMRHRNPAMTQRYVHLLDEDLAAALARI